MDSRGFLWFCSVEGVSRFDGEGFTNFRVEDGLPDRHVNDVLETSSGIFLIATDKGLARLNPKGIPGSQSDPLFTTFTPDDPDARSISTLLQDASGRIWAGTPVGLYKVTENTSQFSFERLPIDNFRVVAIMQERGGSIWAGGEGEKGSSLLVRIASDGRFESFSTESGLPRSQIDALLQTSDGRILAGLRPGVMGLGMLQIRSNPGPGHMIVERSWTVRDGLPTFWLPSLYQSTDGKLWIGTTRGVCLWQGDGNGSVCRTYTSKNDLCDREIMSFVEDKDNNLWIGTACGVKRLARYGFTIFDESDHLDTGFPSSIFETHSGQLIVNTKKNQFALSRFEGSSFRTQFLQIASRVYLGWGWKHLAWQDSTGTWWVPTGNGLYRSPPKTDFERLDNVQLTSIKTGAASSLFRLFEDSVGDIWVATVGNGAGELLRWSRSADEWDDLTAQAGFSPNTIGTVFVADKNGNLWIATGSDGGDGRLIRYRDGQFKTFTDADGAPTGWTRDAYVDDAGRLWLANTAEGLLRIDDVNSDELKFRRYTYADGLAGDAAYCVSGDAMGRIYVGTGRGLDRLRPETGMVEHFTTADGLPASYIELAYRDRKDTLWFGTSNGVVHFQPEPDRTRTSPSVLITHLQAGSRIQPVSILGETAISDLKLASDDNQVRVEFIGLGAALGEKLNFEYRLDSSADWQPTAERTVNFANLAAGNYQFEVRAVSADKLYSTPATVGFNIAAPLWQRWWFMLMVSLAAATVVYLFYRTRLHRLLELERVRTRIATDLHDDIGANLTRISILSEVAKRKATNGNGQMLSSIAEIARESVASMNDIVWAVSPRHDSLSDLISRMRRHAEEVFALRDIGLHFDVPKSFLGTRLGVGVRRDLLLIFKEAVSNAARHSDCSEVRIEIIVDGTQLVLRVSDNGRSFEIDKIDGDGYGIESMQRRAIAVGADLSIISEPGMGTTITVRAPLSSTRNFELHKRAVSDS
jgi:signal transduction histidine kinase/streptogramin lyase